MEASLPDPRPDDRFQVNVPAVIHQTIAGETVIIHLPSGLYYSLDAVGAVVWEALAGGATLAEAASTVADHFTGATAQITASLAAFTSRLLEESLLLPANAFPPTGTSERGARDRAAVAPAAPVDGRGASAARPAFSEPRLDRFDDLQDLLLLDPIHAVDETGWPQRPAAGVPPASDD
jgi:Coenzyme PQQ synthesis protein D (PqqD)